MKPDINEVGSRIKNLRNLKGWTLEEMGKRLNTSKVTVHNWEGGRNLPNNERLKAIAKIGEISVNELLYGTPDNFIKSVLENDIEKYGHFASAVIEYLINTTDLYGVEGAVFSDSNGSPVPIEESPKVEREIKQGAAYEFLESNLNNIIKHIKNGTDDIFEKEKIIESAVLYVNIQYMYNLGTFEGQYFYIKKSFNDIVPSALGGFDIETQKDILMEHQDFTEEEAYKKAIDYVFQDKLFDKRIDFSILIDDLYTEYKKEVEKYTNK